MKCPKCESDTHIIGDSESVDRRRQCENEKCLAVFSEDYIRGFWVGVNSESRPVPVEHFNHLCEKCGEYHGPAIKKGLCPVCT